jgi:hypothetical protein
MIASKDVEQEQATRSNQYRFENVVCQPRKRQTENETVTLGDVTGWKLTLKNLAITYIFISISAHLLYKLGVLI